MADKPTKDSQEAPEVAPQKTPEQIAAEIVGNGRKPVILSIATVIVLGVILAIGNNLQKKKETEAAIRYEKLEAILKADDKKAGDAKVLKGKIADLDALIAANPGTNAAIDALYYKGKFQYDAGDYAAAAKTFDDFVQANPTRTPFVEHARLGVANAKMNVGTPAELEAALKILDDTLPAVADPVMQDKIRYQTGLCNAMLGNEEKAKTMLTALVEKKDVAGLPSAMKDSAERLLGLMRSVSKDEIATLAKEFPASQIKPAPKKTVSDDGGEKKGAAPEGK